MANWFVAFKINSSEWFKDIIEKIPDGINRFHHDDLHMTVAFLGTFDLANIDNVKETIATCSLSPFTLNARNFILLPKEKYFTAFCLDFSHPDTNTYLEIENFRSLIYKSAKVTPDNRKFLPHVTIGRPPRRISSGQRKEIAGFTRKIPPFNIQIEINSVSLYTWADNRHERQFKSVFDFDFNQGFN